MVQGEKSSMMSVSSCVARTSDPFARKAGFEAMQRAEKGSSSGSSNSSSFFGATPKQSDTGNNFFGSSKSSTSSTSASSSSSSSSSNHGAWGPVFQNKQTFASMHFC